jgi:hypothetical protein
VNGERPGLTAASRRPPGRRGSGARTLAVAVLLLGGLGTAAGARGTAGRGRPATHVAALGPRTRSSGCHVRVRGLLPDPACTPGAIFPAATVSRICTRGYSRSVRYVPEAVKRSVYAEYGIASHRPGSYEVDHLVPLEVGGDNSVANLWPQASPGYHQKDAIENRLHDAVCAGSLSLRTAQLQIARDWRHTSVG